MPKHGFLTSHIDFISPEVCIAHARPVPVAVACCGWGCCDIATTLHEPDACGRVCSQSHLTVATKSSISTKSNAPAFSFGSAKRSSMAKEYISKDLAKLTAGTTTAQATVLPAE
jgi:hypothetical protein